jgi:hypothetical protein
LDTKSFESFKIFLVNFEISIKLFNQLKFLVFIFSIQILFRDGLKNLVFRIFGQTNGKNLVQLDRIIGQKSSKVMQDFTEEPI